MRGRVFGLLRTVTEGLIPVATILAGIVADLTGRNIPLVYAGCGIALTCISLALAASPSCRAFLAGDVAPAATPVRGGPPAEPAVTAGVGGVDLPAGVSDGDDDHGRRLSARSALGEIVEAQVAARPTRRP